MLPHSTRKFIIGVLACSTFSYSSFSQGCVIDTTNFELLSPASEYLPCIERSVPYSATIHIFAIPSIAYPVDSYLITTFLRLPSGITYTLNPPSGKLYPSDHACVYLSGTSTDSVGDYIIDYNGFIYLQQGAPSFDYVRANFPGTLPEVSLKVIDQGASCPNTLTGIGNVNPNSEIGFSLYPNPAANELFIETNHSAVTLVNIYNTVGCLVSQINQPLSNRIDVSSLSNGAYIAEIKTKEVTVKRRWVKM